MKTEVGPAKDRIAAWLEWGVGELAFLEKPEARRECEQMLENLLGLSRAELTLASDLALEPLTPFQDWVRERKKRTPLAYLLGKAPFWEDLFQVEEGVFIPRADTETLIDAFLTSASHVEKDGFRFLDLGTGSGNLAVTLAKLFPRARGTASDLSWKAVEIARKNAERLGVENQIQCVQADGLQAFAGESFEVIVSNPPYIPSEEWEMLDPEVRREPRLALEGGEDGLDFYRSLLKQLTCLKRGGSLWVEIGWGEGPAVRSLFEKRGFGRIKTFQDLNRIERVVAGMDFNLHG